MPYSAEKQINEKFSEFTFQISTPDMFLNTEDKLSRPDHNWHGSAIGWHQSLNTMIRNISTTYDRFTAIHLDFPGCKLLAISVYFPTSGKDDEFLDCVDNLSLFIAENKSEEGEILIGTDSNVYFS